MKRITFGICLLALLLAPALSARAATQSDRPPSGATYSQTATMEATIQNIDYQNRVVTLKGAEGNIVRVRVGENAPNFNQLRVGDKVKAQYYQSTALSIRKPGEEAPPMGEQQQVQTTPGQGQRGPSRMVVNTRQITATVQDIDRQNRLVTLKGPEGNTVQVKVGQDVKGFDRLKAGDQVVATLTDAVALSVTRE